MQRHLHFCNSTTHWNAPQWLKELLGEELFKEVVLVGEHETAEPITQGHILAYALN